MKWKKLLLLSSSPIALSTVFTKEMNEVENAFAYLGEGIGFGVWINQLSVSDLALNAHYEFRGFARWI